MLDIEQAKRVCTQHKSRKQLNQQFMNPWPLDFNFGCHHQNAATKYPLLNEVAGIEYNVMYQRKSSQCTKNNPFDPKRFPASKNPGLLQKKPPKDMIVYKKPKPPARKPYINPPGFNKKKPKYPHFLPENHPYLTNEPNVVTTWHNPERDSHQKKILLETKTPNLTNETSNLTKKNPFFLPKQPHFLSKDTSLCKGNPKLPTSSPKSPNPNQKMFAPLKRLNNTATPCTHM